VLTETHSTVVVHYSAEAVK